MKFESHRFECVKRTARPIAAAALLTLVVPGVVRAQDTAAAPAAGADKWLLRLSANEAFESNVQLSTGQGAGDSNTMLDAGLTRNWAFPRGNVSLSGDVNPLYYRRSNGLNRVNYTGGAAASYAISPRLSWTVSDNVVSGYAQDSRVLTDAGLVFPKIVTRTNTASTQVAYELTPRTQFQASVISQTVSFDSTALTGGSVLTFRSVVTRQVSKDHSIGASWGQTISNGITGDIQGFLAVWQGTFGRVIATATGGVRPYTLEGKAGHQYAPGGTAGITAPITKGQTLSLHYERAVEQAYGFNGTHLSHRFVGGYTAALSRKATLSLTGNYGVNTYPLQPDFRLDGKTGNVELSYLIARNLTMGTGYAFWISRQAPNPGVTTYRATVSLGYGFAWR
jgi:hypothetical protein